MKVPELFMVLMNHFQEHAPLRGKGLIEKKIGEYTVCITADGETEFNGWTIKPFTFHIFKNDWLVAVVSPHGGQIVSSFATEDELIEAFRKEVDS